MESSDKNAPGEREFSRAVRRAARRLRARGAIAGAPLLFGRDDEYVFASERSNAVAVAATYHREARKLMQQKYPGADGADIAGTSNKDNDDLVAVYQQETRAYFERENNNRFCGPGRTAYWILNDVYALDRRVIKVRLEKEADIPNSIKRLALISHSAVAVAINTLPGTEERALRKLKELVTPLEYRNYALTGMIGETGRSGVIYCVRRMRPTIALRDGKPLCALCLHPLAYVRDTWVGALPPTDEVIAHLLLIRGDEHAFWKKANQHPISSPLSGV